MRSFFKHIKLVLFNCRAESVFLSMFFLFFFFFGSFPWNIFAKQQPAQRRKLFLCSDMAENFDDQPLNSWHSKVVWEYVSVFTQIITCSSHCQIKEICLRILTALGFKKLQTNWGKWSTWLWWWRGAYLCDTSPTIQSVVFVVFQTLNCILHLHTHTHTKIW